MPKTQSEICLSNPVILKGKCDDELAELLEAGREIHKLAMQDAAKKRYVYNPPKNTPTIID